MKPDKYVPAAGLILIIALVAACESPQELQVESHRVDLEGARTAEVDLRMNAGELSLRGEAQESLIEGTFRYNRSRLKPRIDYHLFNDRGILRIDQERRSGIVFGNIRNEWDLLLSRDVPVALSVKLGAGESDLDFREVDLTSLRIDMGVGEMILNLQGPHERSLDIRIEGGVGSGTIALPDDVGVRVRVDGGLGSISAPGLRKKDNVYTNEAYGTGEVTLDIRIDAGIGSLSLRVEPRDWVRI